MAIIIEDKGVLGAMLDEGEEFLKSHKNPPENTAELDAAIKKTARLINNITDKAAELIDEYEFDEFTLDFSVSLPKRYYTIVEELHCLSELLVGKLSLKNIQEPAHT